MSLMLSQPRIDVDSPVTPIASFDPPAVRPGEAATYRVSLNALEQSIEWPDRIVSSPALALHAGAHGQIMAMAGMTLQPLTTFNYRVQASDLGEYTIPEFKIKVYGKEVTVPATKLDVVAIPASSAAPLQLKMELSSSNPFVGQAIRVRLLLLGQPSGQIQGLGQVQINGEGFIVDQSTARPHIELTTSHRGAPAVPVYVYEVLLTPIASGKLSAFAQAFTANNRFVGGVIIAGSLTPPGTPSQYTLVDSDSVQFQVRPVPREGELPGFTGAVGSFAVDKPELSTNEVAVGEPVKLKVRIYGDGNLARLVPPTPPRLPDWDVFITKGENLPSQFVQAQGFVTLNYTLVPLMEKGHMTPAIPFSAFDPKLGAYADLTISPVPINVRPGATKADLATLLRANSTEGETEKEPVLSGLAMSPGLMSGSLLPLQRQLWFPLVQLAPATALFGLWNWDRRRRFLEQHPDIVRRRRARRALRHERRVLRKAARQGDAGQFSRSAVSAIRVACAPHFPAEAGALVGTDVLPMLPKTKQAARDREVVRRFFAVTNAIQFGRATAEGRELLELQAELEQVLDGLEAGL
jgi:hypothetical protein